MRILVWLLAAGCLPAQEPRRPGAGLQFAIPFSGIYRTVGGREFASDASLAWTIGPTIQWRANNRLSIVFAGLYRRAGRDAGGGYIGFSDRERGSSWELPLLVRLRLWQRRGGPFLTAGPAAQVVHTHTDSETVVLAAGVFERVTRHTTDSDAAGGLTAGGGWEHRYRKAALTLEVRYTRWFGPTCYEQELRCFSSNRGAAVFGIGF